MCDAHCSDLWNFDTCDTTASGSHVRNIGSHLVQMCLIFTGSQRNVL